MINDTSEEAETVAAFRKFNEADQILLLYIYSTETGLKLLPHINFNRIPTMVSLFPSHLANAPKYPYIFSIVPTYLDLAKIGLKFISEFPETKRKKIKVIFIGTSDHMDRYFLEEAKEFAKNLDLEIGLDVRILEPSSKNTILSALGAIKLLKPDFAYISLSSRETFSLLREAEGMGIMVKWVCDMRAFDENLSPFNGVFGVQPVSPFGEDIPGMADIKEAHQKWHPFDSHTTSYVEGWATIQVISEAIGRSLPEQGFFRERVKVSLEGFKNFVTGGLVPPITYTIKDHRPSVESRVFVIKNGKLSRYTGFISVER
jgi:ABC-type branched-subunit amino acid transport system substrate-binding protein